MSFYQYCQQVGFSEAEMDMIVAPLVATLRKSLMKKLAKVLGVVLTILVLCYCAAQLGSVSMHFAALGRLFMIKVSIQFETLITHSQLRMFFIGQLSFPNIYWGCLPLCPSSANLLDECARNLALKRCRKKLTSKLYFIVPTHCSGSTQRGFHSWAQYKVYNSFTCLEQLWSPSKYC